jgi:hypothetical protein
MLTIFALPKPFKGHFGMIQRNAISQWARLRPRPEVLLFGNEEGTAEFAQELRLLHVPEIVRNEYGTPLLSDVFEKVQALASHDTLCYVNADILLLGDFIRAVQRLTSWQDRFLMVGRKTNVDLDEPAIYESPEQETRLRALVLQQGQLAGPTWIDYFVFPRGLFPNFPPFAVGRPWWDTWFLWKARKSRVPLVDASKVVLAVHQNHDYSHLPHGSQGVMQCEEAIQNHKLAGGGFCTIKDATHKLTSEGIAHNFWHVLAPTERAALTFWSELLKITGPVRHPLGLRAEKIASLLRRIGLVSSPSSAKSPPPKRDAASA